MKSKLCLLIIFIFVFMNQIVSATNDITQAKWTKNSEFIAEEYRGIAYGNKVYVAVGNKGLISISKDLKNWQKVSSDYTYDLIDIIYGGNCFVAVGNHGTIFFSKDGLTWRKVILTNNTSLVKIYYLNKKFYAISDSDQMYISLDGLRWNQYNTGFGAYFIKPGIDCNYIVNSQGIIKIDRNGNKDVLYETRNNIKDLVYNKKFVMLLEKRDATGESYFVIMVSSDGANWKEVYKSFSPLNFLMWDGDKFIAIGNAGEFYTSEDGIQWTSNSGNVPSQIANINIVNHEYIAITKNCDIFASKDLFSWEVVKKNISATFPTYRDIIWDGKQYIIVGDNGLIMTSKDASRWNKVDSGTTTDIFRNIVYNKNSYIVSSLANLLISKDGVNWKQTKLPYFEPISSIAWDSNKFIVAGSNGSLFISDDGEKWSKSENYKISFDYISSNNKGTCIAVSDSGNVYATNNFKDWRKVYSSNTYCAVAKSLWDGNKFIVLLSDNSDRFVLESKDGFNWKVNKKTDFDYGIEKLIWDGKQYIVVGSDGIIQSSNDLIKWQKQKSGISNTLLGIASNGENHVVVGDAGTILVSDK